jgi:hypothetical protein
MRHFSGLKKRSWGEVIVDFGRFDFGLLIFDCGMGILELKESKGCYG